MKSLLSALVASWYLLIWPIDAQAEFQPSNALGIDIGRAYGYYLGQEYSLGEIARIHPSLRGSIKLSRLAFKGRFGESIDAMNAYMEKNADSAWQDVKQQLSKQLIDSVDIGDISEIRAREFVALVGERAKGDIESPILETLIQFKPGYEENPEREFQDGYKYKYANNGEGKSKGVVFDIEVPKTWKATEAKRPNIVQKFLNNNGRGPASLMVLIKSVQLLPGEQITSADISEWLGAEEIADLLPDGAVPMDSGKLTLENLPGYWISYSMEMSRLRNTIKMEAITYAIFYKNRMIAIQGLVPVSINNKPIESGGLAKFETVFDLMANSFILPEMYQ